MSPEELIHGVQANLPNLSESDEALLRKAYAYACQCHDGAKRASGCDFFVHPYEVAKILISFHMDVPTICAGLLHDVVEDAEPSVDDLTEEFGEEIAKLVDGVTTLNALEFPRVEERRAENYRKMVVAMARDVRVIIIKLADRLHNMETIQYLSTVRQRRIAKETLDIYAPLAHRLGIHRIRTELEDLAFKTLEPEKYHEIAQLVNEKREEREAYTAEMVRRIRQVLEQGGIKSADVFGRPKHLYSIYRKMTVRGVPFEAMYDLIAFRVLVQTVEECYLALGPIHRAWYPMPERFKDYIALPRINGYQSLHTTIVDHGRPVEVQIRTRLMHQIAEYGVAAHWLYKEAGSQIGSPSKRVSIEEFAWLRQFLEQLRDIKNPNEFLQSVRTELFDEEIFVFTPKGDLKTFRKGATPVDFAFAIHTEIGLHTVGAKVNGQIVPLRSELHNGDIVEIRTDHNAKPSRDWLTFVKTSRARNKIKHWFRQRDFQQNVEVGREMLETELREHGLRLQSLLTKENWEKISEKLGYTDEENFYADIGNGQVSPQRVYHILVPPEERPEEERLPPRPVRMIGVRLDGFANTVAKIARCCSPLPGDDVVGFITRGRGITIHHRDCPRIIAEHERVMPIEWYPTDQETYPVEIYIESDDRRGLVADVTEAIAARGVNIDKGGVRTPDVHMARQHWTVRVKDSRQLGEVMRAILKVRGVRNVSRRTVV